ncbi:hypothetical protein OHA88_07130 [Streptomyces sp. NBC_00353]|uniref:hypothetical protein n=1 Tax=Streptomyces sp. NBC_00353 TaxID=2975722 RepID=UPI002E26698C
MTPRNAPVTPEGRLGLVTRCRQRPTVHVVAEDGVSRQQHLIHCIIELFVRSRWPVRTIALDATAPGYPSGPR